MADCYGVDSRFETDGVFWNVKDPDHTFSAHLSSDAHIDLILSAETAGFEKLSPNPAVDGAMPEHVFGLTTTIGLCTLIGFHDLGAQRESHVATGLVVLSRRYRVDACLIGCHLESDTTPSLRSGWFTYSGIDKWFPGTGKIETTDVAISVSYPKSFPIVDFCLPSIKSRVQIVVAPNLRSIRGGRRVTARSQPRVTIEPVQPRSLEWFIDLACRFENFFSLCLGTSVRLRVVSVETATGEGGWLIAHRRRENVEKPDLQAWVRCDYSRLAGAIAAWFAVPEVFRPLENLVYGAIHGSSLVAETELLSLAQAIESFHRLTETTTIILPDSFKPIFRSLSQTIARRYNGSAIVKRLVDAIRYCNEPSFHDRIESLVLRISPTTAQRLLGDPTLFEQTLRQTRNYFTHPGIRKQSKVLTKAADLFLFNQKLHAFLRLLMLLYVGFEEGDVCDLVQHQSGRWRIL